MAAEPSHFVVVVHVESSARFEDTVVPMRVTNLGTTVGPVEIVLRTRYSDEGYEVPVPRELWLDVRGEATCTLDEATIAYGQAAGGFMGLISVSANAAIGQALPKIAFDNTPGRREREHLQIFVPEPRTLPMPSRLVDVAATGALFTAIDRSSETERLHRAMEQYRLALTHWTPGHHALALMHLLMGMEALTKAALRRECTRRGLSEDELCADWGIEKKRLDPEVRRRILFQGDEATMRAAVRASDGLEHGFLTFTTVKSHAVAARDRTAELLRRSIFTIADLDKPAFEVLTSAPFDRPFNPWLERYVRSRLTAATDDLASADQEYPLAVWRSGFKAFRRSGEKYEYELTNELTWRLGEGVLVESGRFEVWGSEPSEGAPESATVEVVRGGETDVTSDRTSNGAERS